MTEYQIQQDGQVTCEGVVVGLLTTGEDGCAYVEFVDGHQPPPGDIWFGCKIREPRPKH